MADSISPLRAELVAAVSFLAPQIRGLHDLSHVSISGELLNQINSEIAYREKFRDSLQMAISALDDLVSNGYPDLPPVLVQSSLFSELQEQIADLSAAADIFKAEMAANLQVKFGQPAPKE